MKKMYDEVEQIVVFFKNSKMTYLDVKKVRFSNNKIIIQQFDKECYKDIIINFDLIESIEILCKKDEK
jgi:hypothetical protein